MATATVALNAPNETLTGSLLISSYPAADSCLRYDDAG
jgi:hypothetical protein